jgi:hypothetical protein
MKYCANLSPMSPVRDRGRFSGNVYIQLLLIRFNIIKTVLWS